MSYSEERSQLSRRSKGSTVSDGTPHLSYFEPTTQTQFTWDGTDNDIEVSPCYGEPVCERIPVPARLARSYTTVRLMQEFKAACDRSLAVATEAWS